MRKRDRTELHETLEQEHAKRKNGVCPHCYTPSDIHGPACRYWTAPTRLHRTAKSCGARSLTCMDICNAAVAVGPTFPGLEQHQVPKLVSGPKKLHTWKQLKELTQVTPTTIKMARYNQLAVLHAKNQSFGGTEDCNIRQYSLGEHSMPGLEYLRSIADGTAPAVFHTVGNSDKSSFSPGLGHKGATKNWRGIASRADSQKNLVKGAVYDQEQQVCNLLEISREGVLALRTQNPALHRLLSDIEFRHPGLQIAWAALLRQSEDSGTYFDLHQDTVTPQSTKSTLSTPLRTVIVNFDNGGSGIRFAGKKKHGFGKVTYTKAGSCIDFCSNLWHASIKPPTAKKVDLRFTVFLCSKI